MFVTLLHDHNHGPNHSGSRPVSRWEDIKDAIERLDGAQHAMVMLMQYEGGPQMVINGGPDRFASFVTYDDESYYLLCDADAKKGSISMNVGGQYDELRMSQTTDLETVLVASRTFAESGERSAALVWKEPEPGYFWSPV